MRVVRVERQSCVTGVVCSKGNAIAKYYILVAVANLAKFDVLKRFFSRYCNIFVANQIQICDQERAAAISLPSQCAVLFSTFSVVHGKIHRIVDSQRSDICV